MSKYRHAKVAPSKSLKLTHVACAVGVLVAGIVIGTSLVSPSMASSEFTDTVNSQEVDFASKIRSAIDGSAREAQIEAALR